MHLGVSKAPGATCTVCIENKKGEEYSLPISAVVEPEVAGLELELFS